MIQAKRAHDLISAIGLNTHVGNTADAAAYGSIDNIVQAVKYCGVTLLRDGDCDLGLLRVLAAATAARVVCLIGEVAPAEYVTQLGELLALPPKMIAALEGPNEPDSAYAESLGGSPKAAATFQSLLYAAARSMGVPAIANSFGIIWPDPGSYGTTGDLSAWADYGNSHCYYDPHQCGPNCNGYYGTGMLAWLVHNAQLTVPGKPVAHTEFGWRRDHNTDAAIAAYTLEFFLSAHWMWGGPFAIAYGMFDDGSGQWGWFNDDGTPRPVATAVRTMLGLLADPRANAATFSPGSLTVSLSSLPAGENANAGGHFGLYQQANGDWWIPVWNEQRLMTEDGATPNVAVSPAAPVMTTLTLPAAASAIDVFDPLIGDRPIDSTSHAAKIAFALPTHPVLVRIKP